MYEGIIQDLIDELGRLPGVGPKSAQRIAFHIIASDRVDVCLLYTSPSPRDRTRSRMPSSA